MKNQTQLMTEELGFLQIPDKEIRVFDPAFHPDEDGCYSKVVQCPHDKAKVCVERKGDDITRVDLIFFDGETTEENVIGEVGVDSGTLAIASEQLLHRNWQFGGPKSESELNLAPVQRRTETTEGSVTSITLEINREETLKIREKAFELLKKNGLRLTKGGRFKPPLSDEQITLANTILKEASIKGSVITGISHSSNVLADLFKREPVAMLENEDNFWIFALAPGDGNYEWFEMKDGDKLLGFSSRFDHQ